MYLWNTILLFAKWQIEPTFTIGLFFLFSDMFMVENNLKHV
jgi:hypothetical protein